MNEQEREQVRDFFTVDGGEYHLMITKSHGNTTTRVFDWDWETELFNFVGSYTDEQLTAMISAWKRGYDQGYDYGIKATQRKIRQALGIKE